MTKTAIKIVQNGVTTWYRFETDLDKEVVESQIGEIIEAVTNDEQNQHMPTAILKALGQDPGEISVVAGYSQNDDYVYVFDADARVVWGNTREIYEDMKDDIDQAEAA